MANDLPEAEQRGNRADYNWVSELPDGQRVWVLQAGGTFRSVYLPTGLLDWFPIEGGHPDPPPPGRVRLYFLGQVLYQSTSAGPPVPVGGVGNFIDLLDTPANYAGAGDQVVRVNNAEDALEFTPFDFLNLVDTPGSYVGQGGLVVRVNVAETGLEFAAGGGSGGLSHHVSYPTAYYGFPAGGFPGSTYNGLVHWPGWTIMDELHWGNSLNGFLGFGANAFVRETDGATGRRINAIRATCNLEEASNHTFSIYRGIPGDFNGFDAGGITVSSRVIFNSAPLPTEFVTIFLEVFDPTNPGDVVVASVSRTVTTASETNYADLTVPAAALNAIGFVEGDMLRMRIRSQCGGFTNADAADVRYSRISTEWSGGGGSPPVATAVEEVVLTFPDTVLSGTAINIQTGVYGGGGPATVVGDTISLPASAPLFNADGEYTVHYNGALQQRGVRALWASPTQISLSTNIRNGSTITVRKVN